MQTWDSKTAGFKADEKAFIYSIDRQQIYKVTDPKKAIWCEYHCGPSFGCGALALPYEPLNK